MSYKSFMNKVRYLDNLVAKWMMRHFYFMFFQVVLVAIFLIWFINLIHILDASFQISQNSVVEKTLMSQTINTSIVLLVIIINSFWMLYIFNALQRLTNIIKDINYQITRFRSNKSR